MKTPRLTFTCMLFTLIGAFPAMAGPRTFVSGLGNDANPGTREQPKRTFASALSVTDTRGEIIVLDSAGFASAPLTINQSVSIIAPPGLYAGIKVTSGNAITISGAADTVVVLRGLTVIGAGGITGILFSAGRRLHVESCVITGFTNNGLLVSQSAGANARLFVKDTIARDNVNGVVISAGRGSLDHVRLEANPDVGLSVFGVDSRASIINSVASGNGSGMHAASSGDISIEACLMANNVFGVSVQTGGIARVSTSTVTNNGVVGLRNSASNPGTLRSRGNNTVDGNTDNTSGTITSFSGM